MKKWLYFSGLKIAELAVFCLWIWLTCGIGRLVNWIWPSSTVNIDTFTFFAVGAVVQIGVLFSFVLGQELIRANIKWAEKLSGGKRGGK